MKLAPDNVEAITQLGYTDVQARFLYIVATHSGYFTLRQFLTFAGARRGKRSSAFAEKLLRLGHASSRNYLGSGSVFHLYSRLVYGPIDKDNVRNRRRHSFEHIRTRLVLLDFILENLPHDYLESEEQKVRLFLEDFSVPKEKFPARVYHGGPGVAPTVRYFVDKFPLFLLNTTNGGQPLPVFSYVQDEVPSATHFSSHLASYQNLFERLPEFRFLYIAPNSLAFARAEKQFRAAVKTPLETHLVDEVLRYFAIRKKWERHEYVEPVTSDLEFLAKARQRFQGEAFESFYRSWLSRSLDRQTLLAALPEPRPKKEITFACYRTNSGPSPLAVISKSKVNRP